MAKAKKKTSKQMFIDGLQVHDANARVVIEINREDITNGRSKEPGGCAAAIACMRQLQHCTEARIHLSRAYLKFVQNGKTRWVRYHTPAAMRGEIVAFDRGAKFLPGVYVLAPTQPSHRGGARGKQPSNPSRKAKRGQGKKRTPYHHVSGVRANSLKRHYSTQD